MKAVKLLSITLLVFVSSFVVGQQNLTLYNMQALQQSTYANPALKPLYNYYIGLPAISSQYFNFANSGFKPADVVIPNPDGTTKLAAQNLLDKLANRNLISLNYQMDLLSFAGKIGNSYIYLNVTEKASSLFENPKALYDFLITGNGNTNLDKTFQFKFALDATHYREYALGGTYDFMDNKLTLGAKLKYLNGMENIHTRSANASLHTEPNTFALTGQANIDIHTAGLTVGAENQLKNGGTNINITNAYLFGRHNHGAALDVGFNYTVNEIWSVNGSLTDFGFIKWMDYTKNYASKTPDAPVTYSGLNYQQLTNNGNDIGKAFKQTGDSLKKAFDLTTTEGTSYTTYLASQIYLGGRYAINETNFAALLLHGQVFKGRLYPAASISYNSRFRKMLTGSINYSIMNRSYGNLGFGFSLNLIGLQLYAVSDNALGLLVYDVYKSKSSSIPVPAYSKTINIRAGLTIAFGKGDKRVKKAADKAPPKDTDADGLIDRNDLCPNEKGTSEFAGCPDKDGDKIPDYCDKCPDGAGWTFTNGCPDMDKDTIPDTEDACPQEFGSRNYKGCPDKDSDGIIDKDDACPDKPGLLLYRGCPDTDNDGIGDNEDACPTEAGVKERKGCPIRDDQDGDGVLDNADECPHVPGPAENKGCPKLEKEEQEILNTAFGALEFETAKDVIRKSSYPSLNELATLMMKKPQWKIKLSGHTDNEGTPKSNLLLSKKRATAVKKYLIARGVESSRIIDEGFGQTKPIATNKTAKGRQRNRRVEMKVLFE